MKRKIVFILLCAFLFDIFAPFAKVIADVVYEFQTGEYHVVYIKNSDTMTTCDNISTINYDEKNIELVKSFASYDEAYTYMNTLSSTTDKIVSIIGKREGSDSNKVLYSEYAYVDLNTTGTTMTTSNVYTTATNNNAYTYINGHGAFGGVDAAFLGYENSTSRANIKISGVTGWINSMVFANSKRYNGYEIIPLNYVKSPSYYYVSESGNIIHQLSKKITANNCYSSAINLGPAPSYLSSKDKNGNTIKYYSFDGNYFYKDMQTMLSDYKNNTSDNAVNVIPYYNYYMYLPVRAMSNITSDDIKNFLASRGYTNEEKSALVGEELTFKDAEEKYSVNAIISLSTAINESGWGTSTLAKTKNNLFGHNAFDSSVMTSASGYNTVADGIYRHAYYYINTLFAETKDLSDNYHGSHLGNKNSGINVKYASDVYWGEKIAAVYRAIDAYTDYKDYNSNKIGIKVDKTNVSVMSDAKTSSTELYKLKSNNYSVTNIPVLILDTVEGEEVNGSKLWYKIQTDALLNEEGNGVIQVSKVDTLYNREHNIGYVHSSYITLMDENVKKIYVKKDGLFGLNSLTVNEDKTVNITGYLAITGMNNDKNTNMSYDLLLVNETTNETYEKSLTRLIDETKFPYSIPSIDTYSNEYSWFSGNVDLSDIKQGDYSLYVRARSGQYESKEILSNMLSIDIVSKFTNNNRGYQFRTNHYLKTVPIELFIRDEGLISNENAPTLDNMFNQYQDIELKDKNLFITGSSFNVGGNYSKDSKVERTIIFENTTTFDRFEYNLGYIDDGEYPITLVVPDNLDKTRAWFKNTIDLSELEIGTYAIYIHTKSNVDDAFELNDIFLRDINTTTKINDKTYSIKVNKDARFRLELIVK